MNRMQKKLIGAVLTTLVSWVLPVAVAAEAAPAQTLDELNGRWQLAETADEKKQRLQSIDRATRSMPGPMRDRARGRILQRTAPRQELSLDVRGSTLTLIAEGERFELEVGGPAVEVQGPEGKAEMEARMDGEHLLIEVRAGEGRRTTRYLPGEDRLMVEFTLKGRRLSAPVQFRATYLAVSETSTDP